MRKTTDAIFDTLIFIAVLLCVGWGVIQIFNMVWG
jgi:hypothetical protein